MSKQKMITMREHIHDKLIHLAIEDDRSRSDMARRLIKIGMDYIPVAVDIDLDVKKFPIVEKCISTINFQIRFTEEQEQFIEDTVIEGFKSFSSKANKLIEVGILHYEQ